MGWLNLESELEFCREQSIEVVWPDATWESGIEDALQRTLGATALT